MSVIKDEYKSLAPHGASLADVVVLAQAWKKSHTFIRRHNWYADVLELDASSIDLENQLVQWAKDVQQDDYRPSDLLLVPAPKNSKWEFRDVPKVTSFADLLRDDLGSEPSFEDWGPKSIEAAVAETDSSENPPAQKLRPLAHLSIRDQTLATTVMMCLAESVETAQGDTTETDAMVARTAGIVSYGNRLHCSWDGARHQRSRARFSWGNSRTYRQYFQDYRAFLARPRNVCSELSSQLAPRREFYVVSLDIKSFYDQVDVAALLTELRELESEFRDKNGLPDHDAADEVFWQRTARIFDWRWRASEAQYAELIGGTGQTTLNLGLPQGLVASGFLANAYLIRFDRDLHEAAAKGEDIREQIKLIDYCRYVDDMRLVVEAPSINSGRGASAVLQDVKGYVEQALSEHCRRMAAKKTLRLSSEKCTIQAYRALSARSHMSAMMEMLNAELSGTFDLESLTQAAGGLEGLLSISDQIEDAPDPTPSRLALAGVAIPNSDVRDDTVKRFVATRLSQLMRHRLAMSDSETRIDAQDLRLDGVTNGQILAHEFESTARRFIRCWADNPALVLLLRCALDLFPSPRLLRPVAEALDVKLVGVLSDLDTVKQREVRVAEYILADLFRAGAVETGFRAADEYPEGVDVPGYREELAALARRVLAPLFKTPWYLRQQARLFLASVGDVSLAAPVDEELKAYADLQKAAMYAQVHGAELKAVIPMALVAQQLHPNPRRFGAWLSEGLRATFDDALQRDILNTVSLNRPDLVITALSDRFARVWRHLVPRAITDISRIRTSARRANAKKPSVLPLLQLMLGADNVFGQENSVLMLASALLMHPDIEDRLANGLSACQIVLHCDEWESLPTLPPSKDFLRVDLLESSEPYDSLYSSPPWVADDRAWLYGLGRVLRSALTGEYDFTTRRYLVTEDVGRYSGLKSTWYKRRFGLVNSGSGLLDEPGPISPWMSGLLSTLLQWPGVEFRGNDAASAGSARTATELLALVEDRIASQRALFGRRSRTPIYVVPVDDKAPLEDRCLRVAIVQPMRPRRDEFDSKDPLHWTPGVLAEHKRHLAEVCKLTYQKLKTWASAKAAGGARAADQEPVVDVVLFPELAVHPEHVELLRRLSDKLRTSIFTGLTFVHSTKAGGVVNQGLWLIRTESPGHGRSFQYVWQGKRHPIKSEVALGIKPHRPHVTLVELPIGAKTRTRIAAAICYDATDLDLVADLRDRSDMFLVAALNQDVQTFDNMIAALHFHMYQPVVLANSGEFGGSTAQVPLPKHERLVAHVHGGNQVAVSVFEVDPSLFKTASVAKVSKEPKSPPAGYAGRPPAKSRT